MRCPRCIYDRWPISAKRSCGGEYVDRYHYPASLTKSIAESILALK